MRSKLSKMKPRVLVALLAVACSGGIAPASVPPLLSHQGRLLDGSGVPVPDGAYAMEFRFYDDCVGGNLLLTDTHVAVTLENGIYSVLLGSGTLTPGVEPDLVSVFSGHDLVCLGVTVESDSEMLPRQQIVSSGFAVRAAVADTGSALSNWVKPEDDTVWTGENTFEQTVTYSSGTSISWPAESQGALPLDSRFRIGASSFPNPGFCEGGANQGQPCTSNSDCPASVCATTHPTGEANEVLMICYNCPEGSSGREDLSQHGWTQAIESNYWDGVQESVEYNWNYRSPTGVFYRPFIFRVFTDGPNADSGYFHFDAFEHEGSPHLRVQHTDGVVTMAEGLAVESIRSGIAGTSRSAVQVSQDIESTNVPPGDLAPTFSGLLTENDFKSTTPDAELASMVGIRATSQFTGSTPGRRISTIATLDSINELTQTGSGATVTNLYGVRYLFNPSGQNMSIGSSQGFSVSVLGGPGAGTDIANHYGVVIGDQLAMGTLDGDALRISTQNTTVGGAANRGNLRLSGGGWDNGHLRMGTSHVWLDTGLGALRFKDGSPQSESDGQPVHQPPGTTPDWGTVLWGDGNDGAHDSGTEVCALAGLSCRETYNFGSSGSISCNSSNHSNRFMALCY